MMRQAWRPKASATTGSVVTTSAKAAVGLRILLGTLLVACGRQPTVQPVTVVPVLEGTSAQGLHYQVTGSGDPVVLIHAFQMDLREWDEVAPVLAHTRRVIRYDVRGHGRSMT